jgi:glycosyltransferase involved in cell wall biosynthesis
VSDLAVLLPVKDGETFLDAAIWSIRRQTLKDHTLVVVDDGSTDRSPAIAAAHAAEDIRIHVLSSPGKGLVDALNFGVAQSSGTLIARMDADDIAMPERLERQVARLGADPDLSVLGTGFTAIDAAGTVLRHATPPATHDAIVAALARSNPMAHPTVVMRRTALAAVGGYRPAYVRAEDYDLWLRLAEGHRFANIEDPLLLYREATGFRAPTFRRQVESEMLARHTAGLRRAGKPDPSGGWESVDAARLASVGIDPAAVEAETARRALHEARRLRKRGDADGLRAALNLADALAGGSLADRLRYRLRRARVFM